MKRAVLQTILLASLVLILLAGYLGVRHLLNLPFRATNDALHQRGSSITLDFLIPGGTYISEKMTIGEVIKIRLKRKSSTYEKALRAISDLIPPKARWAVDLSLWVFWCFCFMTFFRVFTFMGYGRSLRISLLMGSVIYYFVPDFSSGKGDDALFLGIALLIIAIRFVWKRRARASTLK